MRIRPATPAELPLLQAVERAAGESFRALGMTEIADDEPPALDLLARYLRAGRAWVTADAGDRPVAYLIHDTVDAAAHIEQVPDRELTPGLRRIRAEEAELGLDRRPRVCMRREL